MIIKVMDGYQADKRRAEKVGIYFIPDYTKPDPMKAINDKLELLLANQEAANLRFENKTLLDRDLKGEEKQDERALLSVKEVAALLGKSEKTVRRWTEREHHPLPVIKIPCHKQNTWSFQKSEVLEWFNLFQRN